MHHDKSSGRTVARTDDNVYAGKDGNVYKKDSTGGWSKYENGGWNNVDTSAAKQNASNARTNAQAQGRSASANSETLGQLNRALPKARDYKVDLNRVCSVEGVCAAYRQSTDKFGQENLEELIKTNILMVKMAASDRKPAK